MSKILMKMMTVLMIMCLHVVYLDHSKYTHENTYMTPRDVTYLVKNNSQWHLTYDLTSSAESIQKRCPSVHSDVDVFSEGHLVARSSDNLIYDGREKLIFILSNNVVSTPNYLIAYQLKSGYATTHIIDFMTQKTKAVVYLDELRFDNQGAVDPRLLAILLGRHILEDKYDVCNVYFYICLEYVILFCIIIICMIIKSLYKMKKS